MRRPGHLGSLRKYLRLAWSLLTAIALVVGTVRAGSTYFYCNVMAEQRPEPCCRKQPSPASAITLDCDCCQAKTAALLPQGAVDLLPQIAEAPLVAVRAPETIYAAVSSGRSGLRDRQDRARAGPPWRADRARLMVFLI